MGAILKKMAISLKENALRFNDSSWGDVDDYMKFSGGDLVENGCFQRVKLANVGGFSDFLMGRQLGGDASENGDFQRGEQRLQGVQFFFRRFHFIFRKK